VLLLLQIAECVIWRYEMDRGYHAVTRGFFLNELIRRTDPKHRSIGQFIKEEVIIPISGSLPFISLLFGGTHTRVIDRYSIGH
jgi:hypothetical protein